MQRLLEEISEDMAVRKETKEEIASEVKAAIESLRPRGWRKAFHVLREVGPLSAIITVFVAMLGIMLGSLYQSFAHVKEETQFRTHTEDRLSNIEQTLKTLQILLASQSPEKTLRAVVKLDQKAFSSTLPVLHKVVEQSPSEVKLTPPMLRETSAVTQNRPMMVT